LGRASILVSTFKLLLLWHRSFLIPMATWLLQEFRVTLWKFFHNIGSICESLDSKEDSNVECTHHSLATNAHTFRHVVPWNAWIAQSCLSPTSNLERFWDVALERPETLCTAPILLSILASCEICMCSDWWGNISWWWLLHFILFLKNVVLCVLLIPGTDAHWSSAEQGVNWDHLLPQPPSQVLVVCLLLEVLLYVCFWWHCDIFRGNPLQDL
jgi:hypothetical protein